MANYAIYNPSDILVVDKITEYRESANTPTDTENYLKNPSLSNVEGVNRQYWKRSSNSIVEMTQDEKDIIDGDKIGEKNFNVKEYLSNKLIKDTWFNTDNGDGNYSGLVEEITYTYTNNVVISKTIKTYKLNGTELESETWKYFNQNNPTKRIMKKQGV